MTLTQLLAVVGENLDTMRKIFCYFAEYPAPARNSESPHYLLDIF